MGAFAARWQLPAAERGNSEGGSGRHSDRGNGGSPQKTLPHAGASNGNRHRGIFELHSAHQLCSVLQVAAYQDALHVASITAGWRGTLAIVVAVRDARATRLAFASARPFFASTLLESCPFTISLLWRWLPSILLLWLLRLFRLLRLLGLLRLLLGWLAS